MEPGGDNPQYRPSRKQRRAEARAQQKEQNDIPQSQSRRDFLKMVTPGGWIPEAKRHGMSELSGAAKISAAKDAALIAIVGGSLGKDLLSGEEEKTFKDEVENFSWEDVKDSEKLDKFVDIVASEYINLTESTRVSKEKLVENLSFFRNNDEFIAAIQNLEPDFVPDEEQWGYAHYDTGKIFIDLSSLQEQSNQAGISKAGLPILDALWHEFGHLDVTPREKGAYLNNPQYYFYSPISEQNEIFRKYRGGEIFTDTYFGFKRFEEVWLETITVKRMMEQIGLDKVISARNYHQNGVDFFPAFIAAADISLEDLYQMHANSDFEGFAELVGSNLPGDESNIDKGVQLFLGIHQSDTNIIRETGAFDIAGK